MTWYVKPLLVFTALNLVWENVQLPFYTIWTSGYPGQISYAILHCTAGDVMIGVGAAIISRLLVKGLRLHQNIETAFATCFILSAIAYTVFSEWLNVEILKSWAYASDMPRLPPFGTGLTPVLQWIIVPSLTWTTAGGTRRSKLAGRPVVAGKQVE